MCNTRDIPRDLCARFAIARCCRRIAVPLIASLSVSVSIVNSSARAATVESSNFRVTADDARIAEQLALTAEELRKQVALEWLGEELPRWKSCCVVFIDTSPERMSGVTTYEFARGQVRRWRMSLRGPLERIIESLLPHEIAHTVLASHFLRAIPRWADEGVALMAEDELDRRRVRRMAESFVESGERLSLLSFLETDEYPTDRRQMRVLYAQAASFTEFLVMAGKSQFLEFVAAGIEEGWVAAAESIYGFESLADVEQCWRDWEAQDRPRLEIARSGSLAIAARRNHDLQGDHAVPVGEGTEVVPASSIEMRRAASMPDSVAGAAP